MNIKTKAKTIKILLGVCATLSLGNTAFSNEFTWRLQGGVAWPNFNGSTQNITVAPDTVNQYTVSTPTQANFVPGVGLGYQLDYTDVSVSLGLGAYYMDSSVAGVKIPLINGGGPFDTLNYSATGNSTAVMFEPKIIWTTYTWQPYLLAGVGVAFNQFDNYTEVANGANIAPPVLFNGATTNSFAYEFGLGVQHPLSTKKDAPFIGLDCRFMDWGNTGLSTYTGQPNNNTLFFGHLQTVSVNVSVVWPF